MSELRIQQVDRAADAVLRNLFEHYMHDMAEWFGFDTREDGSYAYPTEQLWDQGCDVFLAFAELVPVGFAVVSDTGARADAESSRDLKEFFVVRRHRRDGIGEAFARHVWDQYPGSWLVRVYQGNQPALPFWRRVVGTYTGGKFRESHPHVNGRDWTYFAFTSAPAEATTAGSTAT